MVDISYDQTKKTTFISYKNVLTQEKSSGDVNGGGGRLWDDKKKKKNTNAG
ncbi:MAG: hypothetical protein J6P16_03345 [Eubacterium sp.]|nr:hypothetical protein [Eubacterium sp.]